MSGLAGILRLDGLPVQQEELDAMVATMRSRGPDGTDSWVAGSVGLAHLHLRTTREAGDHQVVSDPQGDVRLTLDGRIDNRAELRRGLGTPGVATSDPELLLAAYLRWGRSCFARIVGPFAVVVWDGRAGELVLARDFLGKRPLLYHRGPTSLRWASELQAVLVDPSVPRRPNVGMVGEHLATMPVSQAETLYDGIARLPPAHLLAIGRDGRTRLERHWDWDRAPVVRRADEDHVAELLDAVDTAVLACLDAPGPVAAELSGGVDSSAVVATADHLLRTGRADVPLELLGLVFPGQPFDESGHMRRVAAHLGRPVTELRPEPVGADHYLRQVETWRDLPEVPNLAMHRPLYAVARERGARVVLTGTGGDEWFTGSPFVLADAVRRGRPLSVWRTARAEQGMWTSRGTLHHLARDGVLPLLPPRVQRIARRSRLPAWLPDRFWGPVGLVDRLRPRALEGPSYARAHVAESLRDGRVVAAAERLDRSMAGVGLEPRSPLDDRRVVELALALPEDVRRRGRATKWALRVAMAGRVPDEVRTRGDKADMISVFYEELAAQGGGALFRDLAIADLGWVDGTAVRRLWDDLETGHATGSGHPWSWPLWTMLSTERWVRAIF